MSVPSLKSILPYLSAELGLSVAALYERQRALVRLELLPEPSHYGPGGGAPLTLFNVSLVLATILYADRLSEVQKAKKSDIAHIARWVQKQMMVRDRPPIVEWRRARRKSISGGIGVEARIHPITAINIRAVVFDALKKAKLRTDVPVQVVRLSDPVVNSFKTESEEISYEVAT